MHSMQDRGGDLSCAEYRDETWQVSLFRLALIALMAASLATGPALIRIGLGFQWPSYLIPAAAIVGVIGVVTTSLLGRPAWRDRRGMAFRLGEAILLLILARLLVWVLYEGLPGPGTLQAWLVHPGSFFTGEFVFAAFTLLLVWGFAVGVTADFLDLAIRPDEVAAQRGRKWGDSKSEWRVALPMARTEILQRFALRWISFGLLLVVCAALTRIAITTTPAGLLRASLRGSGLRPAALAGLVCYFVAGLLLMSHGRLAVLRGRWFNQDVEINQALLGRWHRISLIFVGLVALIALLLPLGRTSWLAPAIEWLLALVIRAMMIIALLFGALFELLMRVLRGLFGGTAEEGMPAGPVPAPLIVPSQEEMTSQLPPWLGGAILWLVVVLVAGFFLVNFLQSTGLSHSRAGKWLLNLRFWWRARRQRYSEALTQQMNKAIGRFKRVRRRAPAVSTMREGMRMPAMPRDKVRQYYLRAVQEATESGKPRPSHKTPLEYAKDLAETWPETETDVTDLTAAFVDARYSEHEIDEQRATNAEGTWRRLSQGLRKPPERGARSSR